MKAYMTTEEARKIKRPLIHETSTYYFYSDCVECKSDGGELIRNYSGQRVYVLELVEDGTDSEGLVIFKVRAHNGDTFMANSGELNGWIFDTGQWVGPRVN
jgi:hypothetical protein